MSSTGYTARGTIELDDSHFGSTLDANTDLLSWAFSWTNGTDTHSVDSTTGSFVSGSSSVTLAANGDITSYALCPSTMGSCGVSGHPAALLTGSGGSHSWIASTSTHAATGFTNHTSPAFSSPAASVPLPGSAWLLAGGLLAFAAHRRVETRKT